MDRETWDKIEVGDVIQTEGGPFKVSAVDRHYRTAADKDIGKMTVVRVENASHNSIMWHHYLLGTAFVVKPKVLALPRIVDVKADGDYVDFYVEWKDHVGWIGLTPDELMPLLVEAYNVEYGEGEE